jgi:hypothetical protein
MALVIPNIASITKDQPKTGEALLKEQAYINQSVTAVSGNKMSPPGAFVNPTRPGG